MSFSPRILEGVRHRAFDCPAVLRHPHPQGCFIKSSKSRPLAKMSSFSFVCNQAIGSLVSALLVLRSPSAVPRFIVAVVVDAVDRMFCGWSLPHVAYKVLKYQPPFADRYAATAILGVVLCVWGITPLFHFAPRFISRSFTCSVRASTGRTKLIVHAIATENAALNEVRYGCGLCIPARTFAENASVSLDWIGKFNDGKPTKHAANKTCGFCFSLLAAGYSRCLPSGYSIVRHDPCSYKVR